MKKLPPFEIQRIRFGKRLMRKQNNAEKWSYSPDYNVEVEYFGEDEYDEDDDEDEDEDEDEYWYKEDENDWFPPYMFKKCYRRFNASGKGPYLVWLEKEEYEVEEMIELIQKALDCRLFLCIQDWMKCYMWNLVSGHSEL